MIIFKKLKDGGIASTVTGYYLIEWKRLFSIVLLKFDNESREAFHTHAFNCINWLITGKLNETKIKGIGRVWKPSFKPFIVTREDYHKVDSEGVSWVLSFRGPWAKDWQEYLPLKQRERTLRSGRIEV